MKAIRFERPGGPEVITQVEVEKPVPKPDEILVKVKAAGVNRPDVMQRQGVYNPPPGTTPIPGLEIAGEVVRCGSSALPFAEGDAVCALIAGGGYAEYAVVKANNAVLIPQNLTMAEAGGLMETFMTVWSHLFQFAKFEAGQSILIHGGASGIGTTTTMLTRALGATKIFTTVSNAADQKASEQLGADAAINYKTQDFVEEVKSHTNGQGVDVIVDIIAGDYVQRNYAAAAMYGTILQVGVMQGEAAQVDLFPMLAKRLTHKGITLRSQTSDQKARIIAEMREQIWPLLERGQVKPIIHKTFPLAQAAAAHAYLDQGKHFGKLVLLP